MEHTGKPPAPEHRPSPRPRNYKKKSNSNVIKLGILAGIVLVIVCSSVGFASYSENKRMKSVVETDVIYPGISINNVDVGGLTAEEALAKLDETFSPDLQQKHISVDGDGQHLDLTFKQIDAKYDFAPAVNEAWEYARNGSLKHRYDQIEALKATPKAITYEPVYTYNADLVQKTITDFASKLGTPPVNATLTRSRGKFSITPEQPGTAADIPETLKRVETLIAARTDGEVEVAFVEVLPEVTSKDFDNATSLIGSFTTTYTGTLDNPRNINIQTAASKINDFVVYPGEVFSTNDVFGAMTYDNGYRPAPVIVSGKLQDDYGGGVCQVSSTLYNALLFAELDIVERQNHSLKVGYTDYGFDATLAGTYIDLKFRNNTEYPVFIESYLTGNQVVVNIYGYEMHSPTRELVFTNALIGTIAPGVEKVTEDPSLPLGERVVDTKPASGYKYQVYKTVFENGKQIEKVLVNESTYAAKRGEVRVGTGPENLPAPEEPAPSQDPVNNNQQVMADPVEDVPDTAPVEPAIEQTPPPYIIPPTMPDFDEK